MTRIRFGLATLLGAAVIVASAAAPVQAAEPGPAARGLSRAAARVTQAMATSKSLPPALETCLMELDLHFIAPKLQQQFEGVLRPAALADLDAMFASAIGPKVEAELVRLQINPHGPSLLSSDELREVGTFARTDAGKAAQAAFADPQNQKELQAEVARHFKNCVQAP